MFFYLMYIYTFFRAVETWVWDLLKLAWAVVHEKILLFQLYFFFFQDTTVLSDVVEIFYFLFYFCFLFYDMKNNFWVAV